MTHLVKTLTGREGKTNVWFLKNRTCAPKDS